MLSVPHPMSRFFLFDGQFARKWIAWDVISLKTNSQSMDGALGFLFFHPFCYGHMAAACLHRLPATLPIKYGRGDSIYC